MGLVAVTSIGLLARSFIKAADAAEGYRVRLSVLLGSQKEANLLFKDMADFAAQVSFQYEEIMDSATALAGVMEGGRKEVSKWMPLLADLTAASGMTMEVATSNFIRMYSAGAAAADAFRDKGILAMLGFQAKTEYTAKQTRKMLMDAWKDPASKFRDAAFKLAKTWSGLMSMMGDRWFQFRLFVMEEGGVLDYIKAVLGKYLDFMKTLKKEGRLDEWAITMGQKIIAVFEVVAKGIAWMIDAFRGLKMIWLGLTMAWHGLAAAGHWVVEQFRKLDEWLEGMFIKIMKIRLSILKFFSKMTDEVKDEIAQTNELIAAREKILEQRRIEVIREAALRKIQQAKLDQALAHLQIVAKEVPYNEKIKKLLTELRDLAEQYRKEREAGDGTPPPDRDNKKVDTKLLNAQLKAETKMALEENKTLMAALEGDWAQRNISMKKYFADRLVLLNEAHEIQLAALEKQKGLEKSEAKRAGIEAAIFALKEQHMRNLIALQLDITQGTKDEVQARKDAQEVLAEIDQRLARGAAQGGGLADQFAMEQADLRRQQQADIDALLELKKQGYDVEAELNAAKNKHLLEQEQLAANQKKQVWDTYVASIQSTLGSMTSMFNDWYQAAGSKHKELFNLYKAASIAETIISTYSSAQKAYDAMAKVPYVGPALATSAAAIAVAAGLARVQLIRQQQMAVGGLVGGVSPTPTSDNIPISATAGEFMHPVSAVKYYGVRAMEAIRRKMVPREVLMQFAAHVPNVRLPDAAQYAAGGPIAQAAAQGGGADLSVSVPINLPEQLSFIGRRLESEIEPVVMRVLQEEISY
jgi:hypothetical protein